MFEIRNKALRNPFEFLRAAAAGNWSDPVEGWSGNALADFCESKKSFEKTLIYFVANGHIWIRNEIDLNEDLSWTLHHYVHAYGGDISRAMQIALDAMGSSVEELVAKKEALSPAFIPDHKNSL